MDQHREVRNLISIFLLTIVSIQHVLSSSQNLNKLSTTTYPSSIDDDQFTHYAQLQALNITTSIYHDSTTHPSLSANISKNGSLENSSIIKSLNEHAQPSDHHQEYTREDKDSEESEERVIPYSEHEEARDVPTRPKYIAPGIWAKPPSDKNISLDFVPTKLHAQVRGTHTVKRLPQRKAIRNAKNDEERRNAPRLKAVVTNSKVNTVYTEEGYEDAAYDHAGHIRDADFQEGYARKLHDQKNSKRNKSHGNKMRNKDTHLESDFKEYDDDYKDHLEESRKLEKFSDDEDNLKYGRNTWEKSEINPKFVVTSGIQQLEEDTEEDAKETEKSSKIYQTKQESKIRHDVESESSESKETREQDDLKEKEPTKRKKKSKWRNRKANPENKRAKQTAKLYSKKQKDHESAMAPLNDETNSAEASINPSNLVNSQMYPLEVTSLYYPPVSTTPFYQIDHPTTISYGQLFWDYFKTRQNPSITSSTFIPDSATLNSQVEKQTPIAVTTIDGPTSYLLVTKEESTTLPSIFLGTQSFHPQNLFSDLVEFDPISTQGQNHHLLGQSEGINYIGSMNNLVATSTLATTNVETFLHQPLKSVHPESIEYSSPTTLLANVTPGSSPALITINITDEVYPRMANYLANPFLSPILDNSNISINRNKSKYKVLVRAKSRKSNKSATHRAPNQESLSSSTTPEDDDNKKNRDKLHAKYVKMLDYIKKSKQRIQSLSDNKEKISLKDLTRMKPPIRQQAAYSIFPTDRPSVIDYSSVSIESESPRETKWRTSLRNQHRSQSTKFPFRFNSFAIVQPVRETYRENSFPATKLLPPSPLATAHANYHSNKQNSNYLSYIAGHKPQERDNMLRYFPLVSEPNWRIRSRRKRSDKVDEFLDDGRNGISDVKAAKNNSVTNDSKSEEGDKSSVSRTARWTKRISSSRGKIDVSASVPDIMKLISSKRLRASENATFMVNKNSTDEESEKAEERHKDTREIIDGMQLVKRGPVLFESGIQDEEKYNNSTKEGFTERTRSMEKKVIREDHEKLLNESPQISGDIIDKEIATRFNEKDINETSAKIKDEGRVEVEVPSFDYAEELTEEDTIEPSITTEATVNSIKYPFYNNKNIPSASALKYVVDPKTIPRKTLRGMEFYESRNRYKECKEIEPNLDEVLPKKEEPDPDRGLQEDLPRLRGLGSKLDCFKDKYFDENPFDNPLFAEKVIEEPTRPPELDPTQFASKIMLLPDEKDEYVMHRVSKRPERNGRQWRNRNRQYEMNESIRVNYKHDPLTGRGKNAYLHSMRSSRPFNNERRVKKRRLKSRINTTTQSPKLYQTASYQNQVYEDVMGNIRNMANSYQVYEITTLPPSTQNLASASSENDLKVSAVTPTLSQEKDKSLLNATDSSSKPKSSVIKGLIPPRYSIPRRTNYRKPRPMVTNRITVLKSSNIPHIIAHHHTLKMNKRSTPRDSEKNSSVSINKDEGDSIAKSREIDSIGKDVTGKSIRFVIGNDTVGKSEGISKKTNTSINETLDLAIEESRQVNTRDQSLSTSLKVDDKTRRRNSVSNDQRNESPQKIIYTIRDRIRYSKPKLDTRGFGKFNTNQKTVDEDSRRKEPRYNYFKATKSGTDKWNNSRISNLTNMPSSGMESTILSTEVRESGTTELCPEKSAVCQFIYERKKEYPEPDKAESTINKKIEEDAEEEITTPNMYHVHENINEDVDTTTMRLMSSFDSKEFQNLQEYLSSDPPGYAETFPEEMTTLTNQYDTNMNYKSKKEEDEGTDYLKNIRTSWNDDSSEKAEEQVEAPMNTELFTQNKDFEESSSQEEKASNEDQTFFDSPLSTENDKENEGTEKAIFYRPFPFSKYKSKKESEEDDSKEDSDEEESEDYVFPWHADKEEQSKKSQDFEYPWEKRERLARERRRKLKRANRFKKFFDDKDEEESSKRERPVYPWERYDVPSKGHVNSRRDMLTRKIDDSEEAITEQYPHMKYSSKYSSANERSSPRPSNAREISKSIEEFLENDSDKSKEETSDEIENRSSSSRKKSLPSVRKGISRGTLVPEDITQPPNRRRGKQRVSRTDDSRSSRFDSKKLKNEDIDDEEEEKESVTKLRLSESNLSNSKSQILRAQPNQSNISSTTGQRKKRRRIPKNNSTISFDNTATDSITKTTKKRRRRPQMTKSAMPAASIDLETSKSVFIPIRERYSTTSDIMKTNRSNSSGKISSAIKMTDAVETETSTPKIRTIEHRSKVSKEKIVTKTTYPDKEENFDSTKRNLNTKSNQRKHKNQQDNISRNQDGKLMKQKNQKANNVTEFIDVENIKTLLMSEKPKAKNEDIVFGIKNKKIRKTRNFNLLDKNNNNDDLESMISSDIYTASNRLQNISPSKVRNDPINKMIKNKSSGTEYSKREINSAKEDNVEKDEKLEEGRKSLLQAKYIKDPERRLYYYIERK